MSPKFINSMEARRAERVREITAEMINCTSPAELNELSELYYREMRWPEIRKQYASTAKRIAAKEISQSLHNSN